MTAVTVDTLKFVEQLKAGGMPETQAKAIAQAFRDAQGEVDVATKADLRELEHGLKAALAEVKAGRTRSSVSPASCSPRRRASPRS